MPADLTGHARVEMKDSSDEWGGRRPETDLTCWNPVVEILNFPLNYSSDLTLDVFDNVVLM